MTPPVKLPLFESYALNPEIDLETITDHTHDQEPEQDSHLQIWAIDGLVHRDHDQPAVIHQTFPDMHVPCVSPKSGINMVFYIEMQINLPFSILMEYKSGIKVAGVIDRTINQPSCWFMGLKFGLIMVKSIEIMINLQLLGVMGVKNG